jgi:hypothetical protein
LSAGTAADVAAIQRENGRWLVAARQNTLVR